MLPVLANRALISVVLAAATWIYAYIRYPFPVDDPLILLIHNGAPHIATALHVVYTLLWFTTPLIICSVVLSFLFTFLTGSRRSFASIALPRYPAAAHRDELFFVVGEVHKARKPRPVERPQWLAIPRRALFTGIGVFGAVGRSKGRGSESPLHREDVAETAIDQAGGTASARAI